MHLFDEGRKPFLEFLRNLTPQIAILSLAFFISTRLNFREWDLSNWGVTLFFFALLATAVLSIVANSINFGLEFCTSLDELDKAVKERLGEVQASSSCSIEACKDCGAQLTDATAEPNRTALGKRIIVTFIEAWKIRWTLLLQMMFASGFITLLMLIVLVGGVFTGARLID
jgi:hypothetical protein